MAGPGRLSATADPASTDVDELTTTDAPSAESRRAVASPMPLDDPVTIAVLPLSSFVSVIMRPYMKFRHRHPENPQEMLTSAP